MQLDVKEIYQDTDKYMDQEVTVSGWIRNHRNKKRSGLSISQMVLVLNIYNWCTTTN